MYSVKLTNKMPLALWILLNIFVSSCTEKKLVTKHEKKIKKGKYIKKDAKGKSKNPNENLSNKLNIDYNDKPKKQNINSIKEKFNKNISPIQDITLKKNLKIKDKEFIIFCGNHSKKLKPEAQIGGPSKNLKENCREILFFVPQKRKFLKNKTNKDKMIICKEIKIKFDYHHIIDKTEMFKDTFIKPKIKLIDISMKDQNDKTIWLKGKTKEIKSKLKIKSKFVVPTFKKGSIDATFPVKYNDKGNNGECNIINTEDDESDFLIFSLYSTPANIKDYKTEFKKTDEEESDFRSFKDLMEYREQKGRPRLDKNGAQDERYFAHKFIKKFLKNSKIITTVLINNKKVKLISEINSIDEDYIMNCNLFKIYTLKNYS